jgi:ankyrin repeat protein
MQAESKFIALIPQSARECDEPKEGWTLLHRSADKGWVQATQLLLNMGCNPNALTEMGWTALDLACEAGHSDVRIVSALLAAGATPHTARPAYSSEPGVTPLHRAARFGHLLHCRELLTAKADPHAKDVFGKTPLHLTEAISVAQLLCLSGAYVDERDGDGHTALTRALDRGSMPMAAALIGLGADLDQKFPARVDDQTHRTARSEIQIDGKLFAELSEVLRCHDATKMMASAQFYGSAQTLGPIKLGRARTWIRRLKDVVSDRPVGLSP